MGKLLACGLRRVSGRSSLRNPASTTGTPPCTDTSSRVHAGLACTMPARYIRNAIKLATVKSFNHAAVCAAVLWLVRFHAFAVRSCLAGVPVKPLPTAARRATIPTARR